MRGSVAASADQIVVLDGGRIVETGRHDDLIRGDSRYASLSAPSTPSSRAPRARTTTPTRLGFANLVRTNSARWEGVTR